MRLTDFVIVIIAALMFLVPQMYKEKKAMEQREAQEEETIEDMEQGEINTFRIIYEVKLPKEEPIADIIWMKKAAEVAQDAGIPYFNVLKQTIRKRYVDKYKTSLSIVEGVIQLDNDPMEAEYDAHEIEDLVLKE